MNRSLLLCLTLSVSLSSQTPSPTLKASEAKAYIGSTATVCGKVLSPRYANSTKGQPTFLNFDKPYPDQAFTVVIWGTDRAKFGTPEVTYRDKTICVTGKIQEYRGGAEIIATAPSQISVKVSTAGTDAAGVAPATGTSAASPPAGASAQCRDGTYSFSKTRSGTCSRHGGVAKWLGAVSPSHSTVGSVRDQPGARQELEGKNPVDTFVGDPLAVAAIPPSAYRPWSWK